MGIHRGLRIKLLFANGPVVKSARGRPLDTVDPVTSILQQTLGLAPHFSIHSRTNSTGSI